MPSPIAHLAAGYTIYRYFRDKLPQDQKRVWKFPLQATVGIGLSMLPDFDLIPAVIFRDLKAYHNNFSHSSLIAVPVAFVLAGVFHRIYRSNYWLWFLICLVSYDLHVIMDALAAERGVLLFWPLTQNRYSSPLKIFYGVQWGIGWFSIRHGWTVFTELLFSAMLIGAVNYFDKRRNPSNRVFTNENK